MTELFEIGHFSLSHPAISREAQLSQVSITPYGRMEKSGLIAKDTIDYPYYFPLIFVLLLELFL